MAASNPVYVVLITLELTLTAIKSQGLSPNPFQERSPSTLVFLIALGFHFIALKARDSSQAVFFLHASGVIACETLLWIIVDELLRYVIINFVFLLLAVFLHYNDISELLSTWFQWIVELVAPQDPVHDHQIPDSGVQAGIDMEAQMPDLEPANTM